MTSPIPATPPSSSRRCSAPISSAWWGARVLGHAGLDGGAVAVLPAHHADHADAGRPRRRARGQAAAAVRQHRRLRRRHAGADPGRAGRCLAGAGRHRHFELLLLRGRIRGRGVPAGTGQARRAGARVGLGLELRLLRRHADAGTVAGRGDAGRGPRHDRRAFRALGHRGHLLGVRAGRPAVLSCCASARVRARRSPPWTCCGAGLCLARDGHALSAAGC